MRRKHVSDTSCDKKSKNEKNALGTSMLSVGEFDVFYARLDLFSLKYICSITSFLPSWGSPKDSHRLQILSPI